MNFRVGLAKGLAERKPQAQAVVRDVAIPHSIG